MPLLWTALVVNDGPPIDWTLCVPPTQLQVTVPPTETVSTAGLDEPLRVLVNPRLPIVADALMIAALCPVIVSTAESVRTPDDIMMFTVPLPTAVAVVDVPVAGLTVASVVIRDSQAIGRFVLTLSCDTPLKSRVPAFVVMDALGGVMVNVAG